MEMNSDAFRDKGKIPRAHVHDSIGGQNFSPPLAWSHPPEGTQSFALSIIDPHPAARNWVHWLVVNLPPYTRKLGFGVSGKKMPQGSHELDNSFGADGYDGPKPPKGTGDHPYVCTVYALNVARISLPDQVPLERFLAALKGHILAQASITAVYGH